MAIPNVTLADRNEIPQLGFGTWRLFGDAVREPLRIALELGYTHIDTAQIYENEQAIGEAIRGVPRESLFITSKAWHGNLRERDVLRSCEQTLRDLRTRYLDLCLIHWPNRQVPMKETFRALTSLHEAGKVRSIGVSNFTIAHLQEAIAASDLPICVNQVEFHPWLYQKELLEFCKRNKIALTAYSPLGRAKFLGDPTVQEIAAAHGRTPAQICLRWAVQQGAIVIPKGTSREHIAQNMRIFDFSLTPAQIARLSALPQQRLIEPDIAEFG
jgi:diketogulonate reductase-like aldo/keto reductase